MLLSSLLRFTNRIIAVGKNCNREKMKRRFLFETKKTASQINEEKKRSLQCFESANRIWRYYTSHRVLRSLRLLSVRDSAEHFQATSISTAKSLRLCRIERYNGIDL